MDKLNRSKPFNLVYGSQNGVVYQQDGRDFNGAGELILHMPVIPHTKTADEVMETDHVAAAKIFLQNVLKHGPLPKPKIHQIAGDNNQAWSSVTDAAVLMNIMKFKFKTQEMWKLTEV